VPVIEHAASTISEGDESVLNPTFDFSMPFRGLTVLYLH
jgi:hypothetical protein